jgi:quercetin dioxygenase-like cupin family protein
MSAHLEITARRGDGAPPHIHRREDELMVVLEGAVEVDVDGDIHVLGEGDVARLPRRVPHRFTVTSAEARLISVFTPGGCEALLGQIGATGWDPGDDDVAALLTAAGIVRV